MLTITKNGNVGIGTREPSYTLDVAGNIRATGWASDSDRRLKLDITPIDSSLQKITQLQGVYYKWNTKKYPEKNFSEEKQIGLIAQEVETVLPELVHTDSDGYKSLSYDKLSAVLIEAVKELRKENDALLKRIESLELRSEEGYQKNSQ